MVADRERLAAQRVLRLLDRMVARVATPEPLDLALVPGTVVQVEAPLALRPEVRLEWRELLPLVALL